MIRDLLSHLLIASRRWRRRPWLLVVTVTTLTAGLGGAIGVFSVAHAVLWRPFAMPDAERVVVVRTVERGVAGASSPGAALAWQARARSVEEVALVWHRTATWMDEQGTDRVAGMMASPELLSLLGVQTTAGRGFSRSDPPEVVVLSHRLWQARYGARSDVIGRSIALNGRAYTVVGVARPAFDDLFDEAMWIAPLTLAPSQAANFGPKYLDVFARLGAGTSPGAAQSELQQILDDREAAVAIASFADQRVEGSRDVLVLLQAAVVLLLLIACANVGSLLLGDALDRRRELALRSSLGADRARLAGQLFAEGVGLVALAAALGLLLSQWVIDALRVVLPATMPRLSDARLDGASFLFAGALVVIVALGCSLAPMLRGLRFDVVQGLAGIDQRAGAGDDRWRRAFVIAQLAISVVLAVAAALVFRSVQALERAPRGYDADHLLVATIGVPAGYGDAPSIATLVDRVRDEVSALPGVALAALASRAPLGGETVGSDLALVNEPFDERIDRQVRVRLVDRGFFAASGVRLLAGREIDARDTASSSPVVVVNDTLARRLEPTGDVVGRAVKFAVPAFNDAGAVRPWIVVGVVADSFDSGPRETVQPEVSIAVRQAPDDVFSWMNRQLALAIRTTPDAEVGVAAVRRVLSGVDPRMPLSDLRSIDERLHDQFAREYLAATLLGALGAAGLVVSMLGLLAVIGHLVRRRDREIAVRLALGGAPSTVVAEVVKSSIVLALKALAIGLPMALAAGGALGSLLFGVTPADPATLALVATGMVVLAAAVAWWPARCSTRLDLASTLRRQ